MFALHGRLLPILFQIDINPPVIRPPGDLSLETLQAKQFGNDILKILVSQFEVELVRSRPLRPLSPPSIQSRPDKPNNKGKQQSAA